MAVLSPNRLLPALVLLLLCCVLVGLSCGAVSLPLSDVLRALLPGSGDTRDALIVTTIRMPRVLLALCIGAVLAITGTVMQGLFRNPLADPSLIGVTAGATLGASVMIVFAGSVVGAAAGVLGLSLVSFGAFLGGLLAVLMVYRLATSATGTSVATMLLAGIAITALAGALGSVLEFQGNNELLRRISVWQMGGLAGANGSRLILAALVLLLVCITLPRYASALDAFLLGQSEARYLGIDVDGMTRRLIVVVAVAVGTSVALAGSIAFVGLVVPHMMRMLIGPAHRALLPASALAGAILLVLADVLSRVVLAPSELPVGVVTALIGVPFFVVLLRQRSHYGTLS